MAVLRSTPPDARARVISKISTAPVMINTELINTLRLAGTAAGAPNAVAARRYAEITIVVIAGDDAAHGRAGQMILEE